MSNNNFENEELRLKKEREKKVASFHLHIDEDELDRPYHKREERPSRQRVDREPMPRLTDSQELNSFSGGKTRAEVEKDMKKADKKHQKEAKKREKRKSKKNKRIFTIIWLVMVIMAGVVLSKYMLTGVDDLLAISRPEANEVTVKIEKTDTFDDVIDKLYDKGVIKDKKFFKFYGSMKHVDKYLEHGTIKLKTNQDYEAIINTLESPYENVKSVEVQITEGMNINEIANKLVKKKVLSDKDEFLSLCNSDQFDDDYAFLKVLGKAKSNGRYYKLEGYLYPDTYTFYENEDPSLTVSRMLSNFAEKNVNTLSKADGYSKKVSVEDRAEDTGYTFDQIMTIASLIQAEAADKDDMYNVSSVIHNRLDSGNASDYAKLGLDSTIYYPYRDAKHVPASKGGKKYSSKYNTYKIKGLPSGPICNPSSEAIEAAIYPNSTSYYYFCHDTKTGQAYYASTAEEHEYNLSISGNK